MKFLPTPLPEVFVVEPELLEDERGCFARTWCADELQSQGLDPRLRQCSVSFNHRAGTLRGLHLQTAPHAEAKLVRCTRGALYDVAVDLRQDSPTHRRWFAAELTADNRRALYVPDGCAHGFLTLADATEVLYQISVPYHPDSARGVRWNDPAFGVVWPTVPLVMSEHDRSYPDYAG